MNKIEGLRETISLVKFAKKDGQDVVRMSADIHSDINSNLNYNISVINYQLYSDNLEYFRNQINAFKEVVKEREDFIIGLYHPDEDIPVEGLPEEPLPEEPLPEEPLPEEPTSE